jgi:hypothetical protein
VSEAQETAAQPAIIQAVLRLPPAEQQRLLGWSRGLGEIRYGTLRGFKKAAAMLALTRDRKATWPLVKVLALALKHSVWDARSWTVRLGLGSVIATFIAIGNEGAAIVALGGGIGLPLWMLIGAGGVLIGLLADKIKARSKSSRKA